VPAFKLFKPCHHTVADEANALSILDVGKFASFDLLFNRARSASQKDCDLAFCKKMGERVGESGTFSVSTGYLFVIHTCRFG